MVEITRKNDPKSQRGRVNEQPLGILINKNMTTLLRELVADAFEKASKKGESRNE
jgi:hypothetical protein